MNKYKIKFLPLLFLLFASVAMSNGCKIFVARLNYDTQDHDLREAFEQFGSVNKAQVIMDRATGRSRGFGFVDMPNCNEANAAIASLNDSELDGRTIVVKHADGTNSNRSNYQGGGRGGYGGGGERGGYGGGRKY